MIKIPFSFLPPQLLYKFSKPFYGIAEKIEKRFPFLSIHLQQAEERISAVEYTSMCLVSLIFFFIVVTMFSFTAVYFELPIYFGPIVSLFATLFVFMQQMAYPRLIASRRIREIEKNLLPALQNMYVQLNSGVPLFNILVNVANGDYGEVSHEFKNAVSEISSGKSQIDTLEEIAIRNPSVLFRRAIWQIVNGMKEGADISSLIGEVMRSISDEQLTQIQRYGGQLSPLALFYMLIAIIAPSLGTTFIIILSSFISLGELTTKIIFFGVLTLTVFFQIMFLGMIKTRRPTLIT